MVAKVHDRIVLESERVGVPNREGEILEVIPHESRPEFRVRWDDGHVSEIRPTTASYQIVSTKPSARG
jgi:hypothetical protein